MSKFAALAVLTALAAGPPAFAATSVVCAYKHGAKAGHSEALKASATVGSACKDGAGSSGVVVARSLSAMAVPSRPSGSNDTIHRNTTTTGQ